MPYRKIFLLTSSIFIFPLSFLFFRILTEKLGRVDGYFIGFIIYWIYCSFFILILSKNRKSYLKTLFSKSTSSRNALYNTMAFLPVVGVFTISFLPNIGAAGLSTMGLVTVSAIINGFMEEVYWRGLYLKEYRNSFVMGLVIPTLLFTLWHAAMLGAKGIQYHGGAMALVGGAFIMGLLWAFISRKVNSIRYCIMAHITVNFFAFTGHYVLNGF